MGFLPVPVVIYVCNFLCTLSPHGLKLLVAAAAGAPSEQTNGSMKQEFYEKAVENMDDEVCKVTLSLIRTDS